jgi:hypothetical protein
VGNVDARQAMLDASAVANPTSPRLRRAGAMADKRCWVLPPSPRAMADKRYWILVARDWSLVANVLEKSTCCESAEVRIQNSEDRMTTYSKRGRAAEQQKAEFRIQKSGGKIRRSPFD